MIDINTFDVCGFEGAIRGMRMPYESFDKSDSHYKKDCKHCNCNDNFSSLCADVDFAGQCPQMFRIGENDIKLCKKLIKGGSEHRKFLRMIHVQAEVKAPLYWWAEMDEYKYVEANSSGTMHLIGKGKLTLEDFSMAGSMKDMLHIEYAIENINTWIEYYLAWDSMNSIIKNGLGTHGIFDKTDLVRLIKQFLPDSYNQLRMIDINYECLMNIYPQSKNYRLSEWREFCEWIETLPYMNEFLKEE